MLARIFKQELERIVGRYEEYRMSLLRELDRRVASSDIDRRIVARTDSGRTVYAAPVLPRPQSRTAIFYQDPQLGSSGAHNMSQFSAVH